MKNLRWVVVAAVGCSAAVILSGCDGANPSNPLAMKLQHYDPNVRTEGIRQAARTKDPVALPYLVDRLTDSQPHVRFFAIKALREVSGQSFGYKHYQPPRQRWQAVLRWRQWLVGRAATPPAPSGDRS